MSEKRFKVDYEVGVLDTKTNDIICDTVNANEVVDLLNKQQDTIITLKRRLEKINGGYGHLTHKNGLTPNEWVIEAQEKELKNKDKMMSEFIERHSEDIVKISEQQAKITELKEENEQLHHELQQTKEYLQTKIEECKNHKKMEEIVFGVEQAVGYEKALLQFQKGLKRRLNDE